MAPPKAQIYLVGIKGVAMTALAQVLVDAGVSVRGSDTREDFVTAAQLQKLAVTVDDFSEAIPTTTTLVVYTAAHAARLHPQVQAAIAAGIPTQTHAEALAQWFNQKKGVAVCGVGGKSTISAMICWILEQAGQQPSYAVGVGDIVGLHRTGRWVDHGECFVAEADEYVTDPVAVQGGAPLIPRFHYLKPNMTVSSTISFDHPDVYANETVTRQVFTAWFKQLPEHGLLVSSDENRHWLEEAVTHVPITWYGKSPASNYVLTASPQINHFQSIAQIVVKGKKYTLTLQLPGTYNVLNALAAIAAAKQLGITIEDSILHLASFRSTKRRFEAVGNYRGITCFDDYAHHPRELAVVIEAARQWFGTKRLVIAFQPHTYSRTKALFSEFVAALKTAPELILLDIFSSAREQNDPTTSTDLLCDALRTQNLGQKVQNVHTIDNLAAFVQSELHAGDVFLTLGAGDIYKVHELLGVAHD